MVFLEHPCTMSGQFIIFPEVQSHSANMDFAQTYLFPIEFPMLCTEELQSLDELSSSARILEKLSSIDWSFTNDRTDYLTHDLHPYPAKFVPQIPCNLIALLSLPGELVWDPFGGSGTTALEAIRMGRQVLSSDANPIATEIARAKCLTLTPEQLTALSQFADRIAILGARTADCKLIMAKETQQLRELIPPIPNIDKWFDQKVQYELAYILKETRQSLDVTSQQFVRACFSAIVVKASWQDGETRYTSKSRPIATGETLTLFARSLSHALEKHLPIQHRLAYRKGTFYTLDLVAARESGVPGFSKSSVDLVITSPPYANANDYHLYHRFRLYWLGYDPKALAQCEIGSHLRHQRNGGGIDLYCTEMKICLEAIYEYLRPGRFAVFVIGDSLFAGEIVDTAAKIENLAKSIGFELVGKINRAIHRTKRSFIPAARRARQETLVIVRKPGRELRVDLIAPSYKLWPYEGEISRLEIQAALDRAVDVGVDSRILSIDSLKLDKLRQLTFTHRLVIDAELQIKTWQGVLENGEALQPVSSKKDPKYVTHGIHPYKGKFYPQLAKSLFNIAVAKRGMRVLDPFCGSGTVLLEAQLNGLSGFGLEMNPLAVLISKAKTTIVSDDLFAVDRSICNFLEGVREDGSNKNHLNRFPESCREEILSWFPESAAFSIGWLLTQIDKVPVVSVQDGLRVCLSSIIREVSQQDPRDLRIRRRKVPLKNPPTLELFHNRVMGLRRRVKAFASNLSSCPFHIGQSEVQEGDNRVYANYEKIGLEPGSINLVVTSPPYATALPYIDTDRLSLLTVLGMPSSLRTPIERNLTGSREIMNGERLATEKKLESLSVEDIGSRTAAGIVSTVYRLNKNADVGFRRKNMASLLYRYFRDMNQTVLCLSKVVAQGASLFFVLGNNRTLAGKKEIAIDSVTALKEMGEQIGWRLKRIIPITVTKENLMNSKHAITQNSILWFESLS